MNELVFQVVLLCFTGILTLTGVILGFAIKAFLHSYRDDKNTATTRLNAHSTKLDDHSNRLGAVEQQLLANKDADIARMELVKHQYQHIDRALNEIKQQKEGLNQDLKELNTRLTDYIISAKKG